MFDLARLAALRFERRQQPERQNLYNNWDIVQAHRREHDRTRDQEAYSRERVKHNRERLSQLLKLARAAPEDLPRVLSVRSEWYARVYEVQFPWGVVRIESYEFSRFELPDYDCKHGWSEVTDHREPACDLACAAVMLAEFPRLGQTDARSSGL
jgi:hypothetical protein